MMKLLQQILNVAKKSPERKAYIINDDNITYGELVQKAYDLSLNLKIQGNGAVIIFGHKSVDMIVSIVACLMAKRAYIPIESFTPVDRIKKIINLSNAQLVIANEPISLDNIECLNIDELSKTYSFGKEKINDNNIAYIIFTSGSTGEPKGVPISYDNLDNFTHWISNIDVLKNESEMNVLNQASFSFDLSVADIYFSLNNGHTLVGLDKSTQQDYNKIFEIIKKQKINFAVMTPSFIKMLMLNGDFISENYPCLKCIYFCGEPLEVSTVKKLKNRFPNLNVINAYGPTEATSAVSSVTVDENMLEQENLPVGEIDKSACEIYIEDDEIVLKGKSVFGGYLGEIVGGYFKENGENCYRTGDLGYIENNFLYCKGRKDNQIKYMGYRIELGDIESNLLKISGIDNAVVVAKYKGNTKIVKTIKAYISADDSVDISNVKNELSKLVPSYMIPKSIIKINEIPLTKNGKVDRKRLEEQ